MNFYQILGVPENATEKEIKRSYKALVKKYHPDVFQGNKELAEKKIKELNEAYEVLSDRKARSDYDISLHSDSPIEISYDDSTNNSPNFGEYGDWYKKDLYQRAREKYTTHFYGVSRDELKHEKEQSYSNYQTSNFNVNNLDRSRLVLIISVSVIVLLIFLIFILSAIKSVINSNSKLLASSVNFSEDNSDDDLPFIELDLSFHDVKILLGSPDYTETKGEYMYAYYDNSYIVFDSRNRVVDWKNNGAFNSETYTGSEYKLLEHLYNSIDDF